MSYISFSPNATNAHFDVLLLICKIRAVCHKYPKLPGVRSHSCTGWSNLRSGIENERVGFEQIPQLLCPVTRQISMEVTEDFYPFSFRLTIIIEKFSFISLKCLTALVSFLPLIKTDLTHYYQKFDEDLKSLEDKKLSNRNQELVKTLMAQI